MDIGENNMFFEDDDMKGSDSEEPKPTSTDDEM